MKTYQYTRNPAVIRDLSGDTFFEAVETDPAYIAMQGEIAIGQAVLLPFEEPSPAEKRRNAYLALGLTSDELVVALWEKVIEGRPAAADAIQASRQAVKNQYPSQ